MPPPPPNKNRGPDLKDPAIRTDPEVAEGPVQEDLVQRPNKGGRGEEPIVRKQSRLGYD